MKNWPLRFVDYKFPSSNFAKNKEELKGYFDAQIKANPDTNKTGFLLKGPEEMREIHVDQQIQSKLLDNSRLEATELGRTIESPDEVWTTFKEGKVPHILTAYIKFYKDIPIVAVVETSNKKSIVRLKSIYKPKQSSVIEDFRKGMLEYKK